MAGELTTWSPHPDNHSVLAISKLKATLTVGGDFESFQGGTVDQHNFALFAS